MFQNTKLQKLIYHIKYQYPTKEVLLFVGILVMTVWFIGGSVGAMQKNFELRKEIETKQRQVKLSKLKKSMLEYEQHYLKSDEYKELAVRDFLGYGEKGEKLLILPQNSQYVIDKDNQFETQSVVQKTQNPSNLNQWLNFLFGSNAEIDN